MCGPKHKLTVAVQITEKTYTSYTLIEVDLTGDINKRL
jgi:hypothetical protein